MRVAVLDDYQQIAHTLADWRSLNVEVAFFDRALRGSELVRAIAGFDTLVLMRERTAFPRDILEQLPDLKLVVTTGMRNASLDVEYLTSQGVTVCGTGIPGYGTPPGVAKPVDPADPADPAADPTAPATQTTPTDPDPPGVPSTVELTWALIFSLYKRVPIEDRMMRTGVWQTGLPLNLAGQTLGLAGLGNLGKAMVAPAKAFGMNVIAWSENLTPERAQEAGATYVTKHDLLTTSDVISINLVLSDRTRGLFGATEFELMKPTAYLINTSRGPIVDEDALVAALTSYPPQIAGAGLDVYDVEPLPAHSPLLMLENTVLTPHLGYVSHDGLSRMYEQVVEDIAAYQRGEPIRVIA